MRRARQESIQDQHPLRADTGETLDESTVLEHLEADLASDEDYRRIVGIGNGVAIGALLWILLIAVVFIAI